MAFRTALVLVAVGILLAMLVPRLVAAQGSGPPPKTYVVKAGDTLWGLASRFAPEEDPRRFVHETLQLNGLSSAGVLPGQSLILPSD